jgi:hypothetical protein
MSMPVKIALFLLLLGCIVGVVVARLRAIYGTRRALAEAASTVRGTPSSREIPGELEESGFASAIACGRFAGATATLDGVVVQALSVRETAPIGFGASSMRVWVFGVLAPEGAWRARVSAKPQGVRRGRGTLDLGLPEIDTRLDIEGDPADAQALFAGAGAGTLVDAILVHGWRLVDGRLVRPPQGLHDLASTLRAGVAAAGVLAAASGARRG